MSSTHYTRDNIRARKKGTKVPRKIGLPVLPDRCSPSRNDVTIALWIAIGVGAGAALTASMGPVGYAVGIGLFAAIGAVAHWRATR